MVRTFEARAKMLHAKYWYRIVNSCRAPLCMQVRIPHSHRRGPSRQKLSLLQAAASITLCGLLVRVVRNDTLPDLHSVGALELPSRFCSWRTHVRSRSHSPGIFAAARSWVSNLHLILSWSPRTHKSTHGLQMHLCGRSRVPEYRKYLATTRATESLAARTAARIPQQNHSAGVQGHWKSLS